MKFLLLHKKKVMRCYCYRQHVSLQLLHLSQYLDCYCCLVWILPSLGFLEDIFHNILVAYSFIVNFVAVCEQSFVFVQLKQQYQHQNNTNHTEMCDVYPSECLSFIVQIVYTFQLREEVMQVAIVWSTFLQTKG